MLAHSSSLEHIFGPSSFATPGRLAARVQAWVCACAISADRDRGIAAVAIVGVAAADAQSALFGETIRMARAACSVPIGGDPGDEAWRGAVRVTRWDETNAGDNTEPPSKASAL
jgi:hypothetical protein